MALIPTYTPTVVGTPPTFSAAAAGDQGRIGDTLVVKNGGGSSITVTIATPGNLPTGDAYPDKAYTVNAGAEAWIPLLRDYADSATGLAHISYSSTTSVTRAVVKGA